MFKAIQNARTWSAGNLEQRRGTKEGQGWHREGDQRRSSTITRHKPVILASVFNNNSKKAASSARIISFPIQKCAFLRICKSMRRRSTGSLVNFSHPFILLLPSLALHLIIAGSESEAKKIQNPRPAPCSLSSSIPLTMYAL
nr:hypothetical protein CFP56_54523 [Quercus suber]